jgi:hypothetical protein
MNMNAIITGLALVCISGALFVCAAGLVEYNRERIIKRFFENRDAEWRERHDDV